LSTPAQRVWGGFQAGGHAWISGMDLEIFGSKGLSLQLLGDGTEKGGLKFFLIFSSPGALETRSWYGPKKLGWDVYGKDGMWTKTRCFNLAAGLVKKRISGEYQALRF
jgi:hypothetical protein